MNRAADALALASYVGIATIGAWLVWKKGRALVRALRRYYRAPRSDRRGRALCRRALADGLGGAVRRRRFARIVPGDGVVEDAACGHDHAPDPSLLGEGFSWRGAAATVVAAGSRPCSGAILVLVFSLAQERLPGGSRRDLRDVAGHGADDGRPRLGRGLRQEPRDPLRGGRGFARRADRARIRIRRRAARARFGVALLVGGARREARLPLFAGRAAGVGDRRSLSTGGCGGFTAPPRTLPPAPWRSARASPRCRRAR